VENAHVTLFQVLSSQRFFAHENLRGVQPFGSQAVVVAQERNWVVSCEATVPADHTTSLFGIAVPFLGGILLAYALPRELIPSPAAHLVTALFLRQRMLCKSAWQLC
jgi:hypothetical protein